MRNQTKGLLHGFYWVYRVFDVTKGGHKVFTGFYRVTEFQVKDSRRVLFTGFLPSLSSDFFKNRVTESLMIREVAIGFLLGFTELPSFF